ncbi:MAG: hypothetical protein AAGG11_21030 [Pseudomonadota bacterium]
MKQQRKTNRWLATGLLLWVPSGLVGAAEALRDPTRPPSASPVPAAPTASAPVSDQQVQLALQSVLVSDLRRRAMINDRLVRVGDRLAGLLVVDISSDGVVLKGATETVTLNLPLDRVKQLRERPQQSETGRRNGS